jgi:catechol 2,3-dioxygenase-like lactoylglutathione lyase family enzyme
LQIEENGMAVQLNHTIVTARDKEASANFFTEILGLPHATRFGPFQVVTLSNG